MTPKKPKKSIMYTHDFTSPSARINHIARWALKIKLREMNKWTCAIRKVCVDYFVGEKNRIQIVLTYQSREKVYGWNLQVTTNEWMNGWKCAESNHKIHITSQFPHFACNLLLVYAGVRWNCTFTMPVIAATTIIYIESKLEAPIKNSIRCTLTAKENFFPRIWKYERPRDSLSG